MSESVREATGTGALSDGAVLASTMLRRFTPTVCRSAFLAWAVLLAGPVFRVGAALLVPMPSAVIYYNPTPVYPPVAKQARIEGNGIVEVTYDHSGRPGNIRMVKSTGSLILDANTVASAEQRWHATAGPRSTTRQTVVEYRLPPAQRSASPPAVAPRGTTPTGFYFPYPPYPGPARYTHVTGQLVVRVSYDANGGPVRTEVLQSSGSRYLDNYTADFIRLHWRYYQPKPTVHTTTIDYRLVRR